MNEHVEPIAIIGLGARLPGARDVGEFWSNLRAGRESISYLSDAELLENGVTPAELANPDYVKAVPLVPDVKLFDAELFGMTAREAEICDPALRLFLEVAHAAIENAGYDVSKVGAGFGVFSASGPCDYQDLYLRQSIKYRSADIFQMSTLNNTDYSATLTAYKLNLRGPAMTIVTACSSSLVSLHVACQSLRSGECDAAVVGGANVEAPYGQGHMWVPGAVRSADGHCRPFDAHATGTMFGNGSAAVVLKRLSDAQRDNDNIRAVVRGSAINNDGSDKVSFSAPSINGQSAVIMEAMAMAGCDPRDISYVEAHGTATALGDPIEVAALADAYRRLAGTDLPRDSIGMGSVKSNIGHLVWAAGMSEVVKVALSLEHEEIPPTVNFTEPNPKLELERTPLFVNDTLRPWPRTDGRPRRAGVSSLGIGGTNAHAVLEEAPARTVAPEPERPRIVVWSGRSTTAVDDGKARLIDYFEADDADTFPGSVATLQRGRTTHKIRAAAVGRTPADAAAALRSGRFVSGGDSGTAPRPLAFLLPGQGSQRARMAMALYEQEPHFAKLVDRCLSGFAEFDLRLREPWESADPDALTDTRLAQPMLFTVGYALAETLRHWGLRPDTLVGHSVGELTAAALAGVFSLDDAIRLVAARAHAMADAPPGAMLAVPAPADEVAAWLSGSLVVSVRNAPDRAVVGGPSDEVAALERELSAKGLNVRRLVTSHAFHSPMMAEAAGAFLETMRTVELRPPRIPVISAATGAPVADDQATDPVFWAGQVAEPVRFDLALDALLGEPRTLLEVGPGHVLTGLARRHPAAGAAGSAVLASLGVPEADGPDDLERVLDAVGRLWVAGHDVDWDVLDGNRPWQRRAVPGYPYQRKLHWVTPTSGPAAPKRADEPEAGEADAALSPESPAAVAAEPGSPFSTLTWVEATARPEARTESEALALAFLPADRDEALTVLGPLLQTGARVVRVRPGPAFSASADEFRIRPGEPADVEQVFARLAADGRQPELLLHAWGVPQWSAPTARTVDEQLDLAFTSLLGLVQHGTRHAVKGRFPRVVVLAARMVDVSGVEPLDPIKAALVGLTRTLAREAPGVSCKVVDVGPGTTEQALAAELRAADGHELVALRGHRRWVPDEQPLDLDGVPGSPGAVRPEGVYLITGGLGGLGLAMGKALARSGLRPRLVLAGRTALPDDPATIAPNDERLRHALAEIEEMTELGAQVRTMACDVGDARQVNRLLDVVGAQFGPVRGVLHLAGVAGDGMLQFRSPADTRAVLHPKVRGTVVLEEALRDRPPLDFFVSFSSRAALRGLVGSGDYAAANAVLDALAVSGRDGRRRLSINWPAWTTVGMAAEHLGPPPGTHEVRGTLDPERDWVLDEHRLDGRAVLPGTGHLDLVMNQFRGLELISPDDAIQLEDAVFQNALVVDSPRETLVTFTPDGDQWRFQVRSRAAAGPAGDWTTHVDGRISGRARKDSVVPPGEMYEALPEVEPPSLKPGPGRLFTLGGRWQNIDRMWRDESGRERVVQLVLPAQFAGDVESHQAHPALLDGATAAVRDDADDIHLPFMYRRAVFHRPFPPIMFSQIMRDPDRPGVLSADITVVAPDGTLLAEIEGFTMRHTGRQVHFLEDAPPRDAPAASPAPAGTDGIDPDEGGRLLTLLLAAPTPSQVLIRPYANGSPVPIPARALALPDPAAAESLAAPAQLPSAPAQTAPAEGDGQVDAVQAAMFEMWQEALGVETLGPDDEFFELGGDSLSAVQLMRRLRERFGVQLSIGVLFDCPTVRALSAEVSRQVAAA
ncbi:SDR family NAD(P)-dependent oxidoreductase [Micromonospora sp. KLBMP9576]|uniref:type I polyketide synthase n=1 Tax=Micromonospora sp. KLBMP9576 TaxID=3424769 RepID=UPI003D8D05A1